MLNNIVPNNLINYYKHFNPILLNSKILVIDDMEFNIMLIQQILESIGFKNIYSAINGKEGIKKTQEIKPDLVILDLLMPVMDGFEYCKKIRIYEDFKQMPIIVQTALEVKEHRGKAFESGATDFIIKPIDADELVARIKVHLERNDLMKNLDESKKRMEKELLDAREMQQVLIPSQDYINYLEKKYSINILNFYKPSSELGGDIWGVFEIEENKLGFYNVDFAGHGVTAALNTFRLHTILHQIEKINDAGKFITDLNNILNKLLNIGDYATMFFGIIDFENNKLHYATAACPEAIIYNHKTNEVKILDGTGYPVGIMKGEQEHYIENIIDFYPEDFIFLYSDAFIETVNNEGKYININIVSEMIKQYNNPEIVFDKILKLFKLDYLNNLNDDLTLNLFYRKN